MLTALSVRNHPPIYDSRRRRAGPDAPLRSDHAGATDEVEQPPLRVHKGYGRANTGERTADERKRVCGAALLAPVTCVNMVITA